MGVLGLTPFLQRHFPEVVRQLPERLRDFGGKTIVFDGTLITHRFHFAQSPLEYRHVLGWYRIITELRNHNVNAICVFDGMGRSAAKFLEREKRDRARRLILARWSMEVKRQERLKSLQSVLDRARNLPSDQRTSTIARLEEIVRGKSGPSREADSKDRIEGQLVSPRPSKEPHDATWMLAESLDLTFSSDESNDTESVSLASETLIQDQDFLYSDERLPPSAYYDISEQFSALYASHRASFQSLQTIAPLASMSVGSPEEVSESRTQLALTCDEDVLWSGMHSFIVEPCHLRTPPLLSSLIQRSRILAENYKKRSKPPKEGTYAECRMILEALGVPCIQTSGSYEAEGLAAALVRRGIAHFVASEDTDVLVYGAPLLRNISSRSGAVVAISSEEVRRALRLSRAAFMDFALLIGTDFVPRLRNVGPVRALGFITEHSRIEHVVKSESRYVPDDVPSYLERIRRARTVFTTLPPVPPKQKLQPGKVDTERVTELLLQFGLTRAALEADWDPQASLAGNYFADDPVNERTAFRVSDIHFS